MSRSCLFVCIMQLEFLEEPYATGVIPVAWFSTTYSSSGVYPEEVSTSGLATVFVQTLDDAKGSISYSLGNC